jgi:T-complex protein 1 subunit gamma
MIELSRTQDEEVGDGTTSVIILAGEMLGVAEPYLHQNMHPTILVAAYCKAMEDALATAEKLAFTIDINNQEQLMAMVRSCVGTKFINRFGDKMCELALKAVQCVVVENERGKKDIDIKHYVRMEKVPGGDLEDCQVLDGIMLNKDIVHPNMRRRIENPRIILLDSNLEYKKGENMTNIEMKKENDFIAVLQQEEQFIQDMCSHIIALKPDLLITEKGVSGTFFLF